MTTTQADPEEGYHELNSENGYYDLPPYPQSLRRRLNSSPWPIVLVAVILVLLTALIFTAGFVFWPTSPDVEVKQWKLNGISIDTKETESSILPSVQLNVSLDVLVQIANPNHAGLVYDHVTVRIVYRGDEVGQVQSEGSRIKARSTANHTATVELEGGEIIGNAKELVEDYYNGEMNLTTFTTVDGALQLWFVKPLLKVTVACDLVVNPKNQTILSQECGF